MSEHRCPNCGAALEVRVGAYGWGQTRKFDHEQALGLLAFGATVSEVAETFGVSKQRVSQIKARAERSTR